MGGARSNGSVIGRTTDSAFRWPEQVTVRRRVALVGFLIRCSLSEAPAAPPKPSPTALPSVAPKPTGWREGKRRNLAEAQYSHGLESPRNRDRPPGKGKTQPDLDGLRRCAKVGTPRTDMPSRPTPAELLRRGFTFDIAPFPDAPMNDGDVLLFADRRTGRLLIARSPIRLSPAPSKHRE